MHACGHDIHMTCFIGTAHGWPSTRTAGRGRSSWSPSRPRRRSAAAARCSTTGSTRGFPRPDFALALHCTADEPVGTVPIRQGPALASSTSVTVTIRGKGGHGAWPHRTVDPIVLAALVVLDLQTIVSREIEPTRAGRRHRGLDPRRHQAQHHPQRGQAPAHAAVLPRAGPPAAHRRDQAAREALPRRIRHPSRPSRSRKPPRRRSTLRPWSSASYRPSSRSSVPRTVKPAKPVMGAEDFGLFGEGNIPICMFWLGTISPERIEAAKAKDGTLPALHSSKYYPEPAPSIGTGVPHHDRGNCQTAASEAVNLTPRT